MAKPQKHFRLKIEKKLQYLLTEAEELIAADRSQTALSKLFEVIKKKDLWKETHDDVMEKFLWLCVKLKQSETARDGFLYYKKICTRKDHMSSWIDAIKKYIFFAEEKAAECIEDEDTGGFVPRMDMSASLSGLENEATHQYEHIYNKNLNPNQVILWEAYQDCLDLLVNDVRVERLYQYIAEQAFRYVLKNGGGPFFRKLYNLLHKHLKQLQRSQIHKKSVDLTSCEEQKTSIDLTKPNWQSVKVQMEIRLVQLETAFSMRLFGDGLNAMKDIHALITASVKRPEPSVLALYFHRLGLVFAKTQNCLFYAFSLHLLFHQFQSHKGMKPEVLNSMASKVVCATLAVPIHPDFPIRKKIMLTSLLMETLPPTRQSLIDAVTENQIMCCASSELQNLYHYLVEDFQPLTAYTNAKPILELMRGNKDLEQFLLKIERNILTLVLEQLSQDCCQVKLSDFSSLVPSNCKSPLEDSIFEIAEKLKIQVQVDYSTDTLSFGTDTNIPDEESDPDSPLSDSDDLTSMENYC